MSGVQYTLGGQPIDEPFEILGVRMTPETWSGRLSEIPTPDPDKREDWCAECESRITIGTDGQTEYGHKWSCGRKARARSSGGGDAA